MKKIIYFFVFIILFSTCKEEPLPEVLTTFILENKTNDNIKVTLYGKANDTTLLLNSNDSYQFSYFSTHRKSSYSTPLDEFDSLDIRKGNKINRFKYKDHTGPFDIQNYLTTDTIIETAKNKCCFYRYTFIYSI